MILVYYQILTTVLYNKYNLPPALLASSKCRSRAKGQLIRERLLWNPIMTLSPWCRAPVSQKTKWLGPHKCRQPPTLTTMIVLSTTLRDYRWTTPVRSRSVSGWAKCPTYHKIFNNRWCLRVTKHLCKRFCVCFARKSTENKRRQTSDKEGETLKRVLSLKSSWLKTKTDRMLLGEESETRMANSRVWLTETQALSLSLRDNKGNRSPRQSKTLVELWLRWGTRNTTEVGGDTQSKLGEAGDLAFLMSELGKEPCLLTCSRSKRMSSSSQLPMLFAVKIDNS